MILVRVVIPFAPPIRSGVIPGWEVALSLWVRDSNIEADTIVHTAIFTFHSSVCVVNISILHKAVVVAKAYVLNKFPIL
jgi:hypothetical protein